MYLSAKTIWCTRYARYINRPEGTLLAGGGKEVKGECPPPVRRRMRASDPERSEWRRSTEADYPSYASGASAKRSPLGLPLAKQALMVHFREPSLESRMQVATEMG